VAIGGARMKESSRQRRRGLLDGYVITSVDLKLAVERVKRAQCVCANVVEELDG
jgi:hypothetical protein